MARNGSGTYILPAGNPVAPSTVIESTWANDTLTDVATALTGSLPVNGEKPMAAQLKLIDGTSSIPAISFNSSSSTGVFLPAVGSMAATVQGVEVLRAKSTGSVLIGSTTDTGEKFQVTGTAKITGNTAVGGTLTVTGVTTFADTVTGGGVISSGTTPYFQLNETDQVLPAGRWRLRSSADAALFFHNTAVAGDFSTSASIWRANADNTLDVLQPASFSSTLDVTGATTLAALSATTGSFSSTLSVTGVASFVDVAGFANGTAAAPSVAFTGDTNTGLYRAGADILGFTTGGTFRLQIGTTRFLASLPWEGQDGTAAAPALTFSSDNDTGIYSGGANILAFSTAGTMSFRVNSTPGVHVGDSTLDAAASSVGIYSRSRLVSAATTQYGVYENTRFTTSDTTAASGVYVANRFEDGAYTTGTYNGVRVTNPGKGAGQTITTAYGIYVDPLSAATNNRGLRLGIGAAATNYNVYADGDAQNYFAGNVGIGVASPAYALDIVGHMQATTANAGFGLTLTNTAASTSGSRLALYHDRAAPAASDLTGEIRFNANDSAGNATVYAQIYQRIVSPTNGSESGELDFYTISGGSSYLGFKIREGEPIMSSVDVTDIYSVGYRGVPQMSKSANYTLVLSDAGKHVYHPLSDTAGRTFTIPANASVAFPIGTVVSFVNMDTANCTIAITTDTMYLAGAGSTGSRTLSQYGIATAIKTAATEWLISGTNLS